MTGNYLGETPVTDLTDTPFEGNGPAEWAMEFISRYGGIDGDHHKAWVLDQVARCLCGTPVEVSLAAWSTGEREYRIRTGKPSADYLEWAESIREGGEYDHDEGVAP